MDFSFFRPFSTPLKIYTLRVTIHNDYSKKSFLLLICIFSVTYQFSRFRIFVFQLFCVILYLD